MDETTQLQEQDPASMLTAEPAPLTSLASAPGRALSAGLMEAGGVQTVAAFSDAASELSALITGAAAFDQGARVRLRITGQDRVRWLNGMVTNAVKSLATGSHQYTFILNAQGRIQGDATIFAFADHLVLETERGQAEKIFTHLDRFIIMDDVELAWIEGETTLGLAGPSAEALLRALGLPTPERDGCVSLGAADAGPGTPMTLVAEARVQVSRFSLWVKEGEAPSLWQRLLAAGATAAGGHTLHALRVLEGTPAYGIDITEKTLAQETGQLRALNFNKGCYLGQEIVERVRSRANVHRAIRQFALHGEPAVPGTSLIANGAVVGELTSVSRVTLPGLPAQVGLGLVRVEALQALLSYAGGKAEPLTHAPLLDPAQEER